MHVMCPVAITCLGLQMLGRCVVYIPGIESASAARPLGEDTDTAHLHDEEKGGDDWFPLSPLVLNIKSVNASAITELLLHPQQSIDITSLYRSDLAD